MAYARKFLSDTHFNTNPSPPPPSLPSPVPNPPEVVTEETDFVIILAALLCALICVVGLLAVARCAWLRRGLSGAGGGGGAGGSSRIANKGLKKKVLNSLPKYTYSSDINKIQPAEVVAEKSTTEKSTVVEVEDCAICLSEYVDGDEIRVLPQCGHRFHVQCIDTWLGSHSSCPSCRQILVQGRCRKCGEFPAGGSTGASRGYTFVKPTQTASCSTSPPAFLP